MHLTLSEVEGAHVAAVMLAPERAVLRPSRRIAEQRRGATCVTRPLVEGESSGESDAEEEDVEIIHKEEQGGKFHRASGTPVCAGSC